MAIYNKVFGNFSGGVLTPRMQMHYESEYFKNSADTIENFKLTSQGNLKKRFGSKVVFNTPAPSLVDDVKLVIFGGYCYAFYKLNPTVLTYLYTRLDDNLDSGTNSVAVANMEVGEGVVSNFDFSLSPGEYKLYITTGGVPIILTQTTPGEPFLDSDIINHDFESYPTVSTFYQGRLWLSGFIEPVVAGTEVETNRVLGSHSGIYDDFVFPPSPAVVTDADPVDFKLDRSGNIKFLLGGKALHCGHAKGISSIDAPLITTSNAFLKRQSSIPMGSVDPIEFNGGFLYSPVSDDGVYYSLYSRERQSWNTMLLSNKSNEITEGIKEIHRYNDGSEMLCCLLKDGSQSHYIIADNRKSGGWVHYKGVEVLSTVYDNNELSSQYSVVKLGDNIVLTKTSDDYLDCEILVLDVIGSLNTIVTGLELFNDTKVLVKKDSILIFIGVVSGGVLDIGEWSDTFDLSIGYGYDSILKTLPTDNLVQGNVLLDLKKNYDIAVRLIGSYPFINGADTYLVDPNNINSVLLDEITTLSKMFIGFTADTTITVESRYPYELEIFGISIKGVLSES